MTAAVTNPFKLTWGSFVVGGTTERLITNVHRITRDFISWEATFDVVVRGTSDATFAANVAEMETEFTKRRQAILFEVGSETIHSFDPASDTNTGLNSYARIEKVGTPGADTDRSRLYTITVGCELPATDTSGRRDSQIIVEYDPARIRTVTISGTWTAITTKEATEQYADSIAAFCSSALSALVPAGTFGDLLTERTEADDQDKTIKFVRVYRETGHIAADDILGNANIVGASIGFSKQTDAPGDSGSGNVKRLTTIRIRFDCALDKTQSVDLATLYSGTVRPYMISQMQTKYSPAQFGITREVELHQTYENRASAEMEIQAAIDPSDVLEAVITSRIVEGDLKALTGKWTGKLFAKYVDQSIGTRLRFTIRAIRVFGQVGPQERGGGSENFSGDSRAFDSYAGNFDVGGFAGWVDWSGSEWQDVFGDQVGSGGGGGWILKDNDSATTTRWLGQPGGDQFAVTDIVEQLVHEWVVD